MALKRLKKIVARITGNDWPTSGTVVGKRIDPPRQQDYSAVTRGVVGVKSINVDPVHWLEIKDGSKKPVWVITTKADYNAHDLKDHWERKEGTSTVARR